MEPRQIRRLRGRLLATQEQFAKIIHTSSGNVSRWENGYTEPSEWHIEIMRTIQRGVDEFPEAADDAFIKLEDNDPIGALATLLAAAVPGSRYV